MRKGVTVSMNILLFGLLFFAMIMVVSHVYLTYQIGETGKKILSLSQTLDRLSMQFDSLKVSDDYLAIKNTQLELQDKIFEIELERQKQQLFWSNISFLGVSTILGFLTLLLWVPKEIEKRAKNEVDEKIGDAIRGRSRDIQEMLKEYDEETMFCSSKKIFVKGGQEKENEKIRNLLIENGFSPNNIFLNEEKASKEGYQILLINNLIGDFLSHPPQNEKDTGKPDPEKVKEYNDKWNGIQELLDIQPPEICIFYYSEAGVNFPIYKIQNYDLKKRINFATNPAQIYGNLINTLKYQHRLQMK